jgi:hypothetical protein
VPNPVNAPAPEPVNAGSPEDGPNPPDPTEVGLGRGLGRVHGRNRYRALGSEESFFASRIQLIMSRRRVPTSSMG